MAGLGRFTEQLHPRKRAGGHGGGQFIRKFLGDLKPGDKFRMGGTDFRVVKPSRPTTTRTPSGATAQLPGHETLVRRARGGGVMKLRTPPKHEVEAFTGKASPATGSGYGDDAARPLGNVRGGDKFRVGGELHRKIRPVSPGKFEVQHVASGERSVMPGSKSVVYSAKENDAEFERTSRKTLGPGAVGGMPRHPLGKASPPTRDHGLKVGDRVVPVKDSRAIHAGIAGRGPGTVARAEPGDTHVFVQHDTGDSSFVPGAYYRKTGKAAPPTGPAIPETPKTGQQGHLFQTWPYGKASPPSGAGSVVTTPGGRKITLKEPVPTKPGETGVPTSYLGVLRSQGLASPSTGEHVPLTNQLMRSLARLPVTADASAEVKATHRELRRQFGMNPDIRKPGGDGKPSTYTLTKRREQLIQQGPSAKAKLQAINKLLAEKPQTGAVTRERLLQPVGMASPPTHGPAVKAKKIDTWEITGGYAGSKYTAWSLHDESGQHVGYLTKEQTREGYSPTNKAYNTHMRSVTRWGFQAKREGDDEKGRSAYQFAPTFSQSTMALKDAIPAAQRHSESLDKAYQRGVEHAQAGKKITDAGRLEGPWGSAFRTGFHHAGKASPATGDSSVRSVLPERRSIAFPEGQPPRLPRAARGDPFFRHTAAGKAYYQAKGKASPPTGRFEPGARVRSGGEWGYAQQTTGGSTRVIFDKSGEKHVPTGSLERVPAKEELTDVYRRHHSAHENLPANIREFYGDDSAKILADSGVQKLIGQHSAALAKLKGHAEAGNTAAFTKQQTKVLALRDQLSGAEGNVLFPRGGKSSPPTDDRAFRDYTTGARPTLPDGSDPLKDLSTMSIPELYTEAARSSGARRAALQAESKRQDPSGWYYPTDPGEQAVYHEARNPGGKRSTPTGSEEAYQQMKATAGALGLPWDDATMRRQMGLPPEPGQTAVTPGSTEQHAGVTKAKPPPTHTTPETTTARLLPAMDGGYDAHMDKLQEKHPTADLSVNADAGDHLEVTAFMPGGSAHHYNVWQNGVLEKTGHTDAAGEYTSTAEKAASIEPKLSGPGRGPTGKLRNFKSMSDSKLESVVNQLAALDNDPEAFTAANAEWSSRQNVAFKAYTTGETATLPGGSDPLAGFTKPPPAPSYYASGRGPTGKLRNFKAMSSSKFVGVHQQVLGENNDAEAIAAVKAEHASRFGAPKPAPAQSTAAELGVATGKFTPDVGHVSATSAASVGSLAGKRVVVTGVLTTGTRKMIHGKIAMAGGKPQPTITNSTDLLVVGDAPGSKLAKAKALGIPVITEHELAKLMEARVRGREGIAQRMGELLEGSARWKAMEESELSTGERKRLPKGAFAIPEKAPGSGSYPIHDKAHARNALARVSQHGDGKTKARVRAAVYSRYPELKH